MTFYEPLLIRFRQRGRCFNCGAPAQTRCRTHGTRICSDIDCLVGHRRSKRAVYGDLTRPFCEYSQIRRWEWVDWVVAIGSAFVVAVGVVIILVHA